MKKIIILIFTFVLLVGCETKSERDARLKQEEINKIKEEIGNTDIPKEATDWIVSTKVNKVLTVFCITTSKKCIELKKTIDEIKKNYDFESFFYNIDELDDSVKKLYKTTYKLNDYTGYVPYIMITNKDKLIATHTDTFDKDELIDYLSENKMITLVSTK